MRDAVLHSETSQSILRALLYYDIFGYPITAKEIFCFMDSNYVSLYEVEESLKLLSDRGHIFHFDKFYSVQNNPALIERRIKGNANAKGFQKLAFQKGKFICSFPFVRAVFASGSFSKNYMDEDSDLDFFIITAPERLWIARTLLVMYKRFFLFNSHKYFCVNYFVDANHLEIEEKNIYTATELATLVPLCCGDYHQRLLDHNSWLKTFFPNFQLKKNDPTQPENSRRKNFFESVINLIGANRLDNFFMSLTNRRWQTTYAKKYTSKDFNIAFKTKKYTSKNHPNHYQNKVVKSFHEKLTTFARQFDIQWLHE